MDVDPTLEDIELVESLNITSYEQLIRGVHLTLEDTVLHDTSLIFNRGKPRVKVYFFFQCEIFIF